jgi:DinB family protein
MTTMAIVLLAVIWPMGLQAQTPISTANPVSDTVRQFLATHSKNLIASAELMPADKYAYHPTPAQMTFGELVVHVVQTNEFLCSAIAGAPKPPPTTPVATDPKEALVKAIKDSFDHCAAALASVNDKQLGDPISMGRGPSPPRAYMMITIAADWADHYSTAASYLRLNGLLPPTARQAR